MVINGVIDELYQYVNLYIGNDNVKTIIEAGACDCEDSIKLSEQYPKAHIYAFEPNPATIPLCRAKANDRITLIEKAVSNIDGEVTFYPIDTKMTVTTHEDGNPGASSMFKASKDYPTEKYVQNEIKVPSITLKSFCNEKNIESIDILRLDAQGSELSILRGLGDIIHNVKIIQTEVLFKQQYIGAPLFYEIVDFLESKDFRFARYITKYEWFGDALFIKNNL